MDEHGQIGELAGHHLVVMGVAGSGKSTVGEALAATLGVPFAEGDDFHSDEARAKMAAGVPLTDADRWPWLDRLVAWMDGHADTGCVVSCSALRHAYRDRLRAASGVVECYELDVDPDDLRQRMAQRVGHYMPVELLESQLATLEPLDAGEGVRLDGTLPVADLVTAILEARRTR
ncbi:MAG: gluconokinase [Propionibacteriaceae bacterium]|nr:gluconokinase [Propionibacteriaceae bacterium]